ncbi:MAG TPA: SpoIIE family protein phosphatase [candidate division Zixibacteria bacterium]|jgi:serine phosphatase RsbU (regulator of sigma subunit)/anti-sigma regulatory factor (Ser/Thr protein kinase)
MAPILSEHYAAFPASNDALDDIREFVQAALIESSLRHNAVAGLLLALEEAVTNIIRHGYLYGPGHIRLRVRRHRREVQIVLTDTGRPMTADFDDKPDPSRLVRTQRQGGLGMLLMSKVTDRIDYRRVGDQNILTIYKSIGPGGIAPSFARTTRRTVAWAAGALVALGAVAATLWSHNRAERAIETAFFSRWQEFGRTAAASSAQAVFNDRSDVELDQLIVGLAQANAEVAYLFLIDAHGSIRADLKHPERVHESYSAPPSHADEDTGRPVTRADGESIFHFSEPARVGADVVVSVVYGVPCRVLSEPIESRRREILATGAIALVGGELVVLLLVVVMARPLRKLGDVVQRMRSGQTAPAVPSTAGYPDEVEQVVAAMNEMVQAVTRAEQQMARQDVERREIEQARHLQQALLPGAMPQIDGFEVAGTHRMARQVGGDYYDVFPIRNDRWVLFIADVAGKGFPAALMMTAVRTALRLLAPSHDSPRDILIALNDFIETHHAGGPFVTACCGVLDPDSARLTVASAGHTPLLHRRGSDRPARHIRPKGRPLGVGLSGNGHHTFADSLEEEVVELGAHDLCLLYTDGLSEATDGEGREFGAEGIEGCLDGVRTQTAAEIVELVMGRSADLVTSATFTDAASATDDVTLVVLKRTATLLAAGRTGESIDSKSVPGR